jgi:hypothetical protein
MKGLSPNMKGLSPNMKGLSLNIEGQAPRQGCGAPIPSGGAEHP